MMRSIEFSNFYSFYEPSEISFQRGNSGAPDNYEFMSCHGERINKIISVIGPNGSGKTRALMPLAFVSWFVSNPVLNTEPDTRIPCEGHKLHPDEPTKFTIDFELEGESYKYNLVIESGVVYREALYVKTSRQYSYMFIREYNSDTGSYSLKQRGFGIKVRELKDVRGNVSLISAANSLGSPTAYKLSQFFRTFNFNVTSYGRRDQTIDRFLDTGKYFHSNPQHLESAIKIIKNSDLGISSIHIEKVKTRKGTDDERDLYIPVCVHKQDNESFTLDIVDESNGTKSLFILLHIIVPTLSQGGVAIIDEIDNDLHPLLLSYLIGLFSSPSTNPKNAQIIFTCHTPEVLNQLRKHQVYLVEKVAHRSEIWRLDSVAGLRTDDNLYAKYMSGAIDAIPNVAL